ncbi:tyrosine-type recombinase/integrase [Kitasatospora sp. NBC_01287]|uniref:tyrosine-type recombinase/integrase n=1 Tax=Kitasatospora sp. NBC_01287 TaxID=2903573 RepID=UPI0022536893|nr:tyrosine-type recombinase/integrase [Kitasatospora sp. NBC_01287]MCX4745538.1 tyrosine-type recombinase/integrase [Kitasatospora sp. NBC_01287]
MKAFPVKLPSGDFYWTVLDGQLAIVPEADAFLRHVRFGRAQAELTTKTYAGSIALYLRWCARTGRDWRTAAVDLSLFITWLRYASAELTGAEPPALGTAMVLTGPGMKPQRGGARIENILVGVRTFLRHAVSTGSAPGAVLSQLYEMADARDLPLEARGEGDRMAYRLRAQHRVSVPRARRDRAADEEVLALLRACHLARDRFIVLLLARAGLRRGEAAGLRREDMHFMPDSTPLGCLVRGSHVHVVRRANSNGAWAKSVRERWVPADWLVVQAYDQYVLERLSFPHGEHSDFALVNILRGSLGAPMSPDAVTELIERLGQRGGVDRAVTAHMLRHGFASNVGDSGGTVDEIAQLLGHSQFSSSEPYLHPAQHRIREAVERVPSPVDAWGALR